MDPCTLNTLLTAPTITVNRVDNYSYRTTCTCTWLNVSLLPSCSLCVLLAKVDFIKYKSVSNGM